MAHKNKTRLDLLLVERGLAETRTKAQAMILAGVVLVNDVPATKAGQEFANDAMVRIKGETLKFVGRGGLKLEGALDAFKIDVTGTIAVDMGASTGGFTDCLLQRGTKKIYAVDVGYGQLDWRLQKDPRVISIERTNIRHWDAKEIKEPVSIVVIDVSFISLALIFPKVDEILGKKGTVIALIKPQFEVGKGKVGKGGIVKEEAYRGEAIDAVRRFAENYKWEELGLIDSPITGAKGNKEYLICFRKPF